ncbi:MAG: NfeD family protein [Mariprofundaceae bacterium]|nr:NfeD family protein [Mariprofundaceae bacterium]
MLEFLSLEIWHLWLLAACVIAVVELLLLNSYYLLAVVGGAAIVGVISAIWDMSLTVQWFIFALATSMAAWGLHLLRSPSQQQHPDDIRYMEGRLVKVTERISPRGRVEYKSVSWAAESKHCFEVGETACIERIHGSTLYVTKIASD